MNISVFYVGTSLLGPLKKAEQEITRTHSLELAVAAHNLGLSLPTSEWNRIAKELAIANIVFVFHVTDTANSEQLIRLLKQHEATCSAVIVINCLPDLMRQTRMGKLRFASRDGSDVRSMSTGSRARRLVTGVAGWMGEAVKSRRSKTKGHGQYLKLIERVPSLLKFVPATGKLRDLKHYVTLFCYFLQPTPTNVRNMLLYALKHYAESEKLSKVKLSPPEAMPSSGIYHPDAPDLFSTFESYQRWYEKPHRHNKRVTLDAANTVGLLLMRTQIVSATRKHYDDLIRAIENEGLAVIPAISTFMDNREACERFFVEDGASRVGQVVSLTGFSFVGGPAMNDSDAAVEFLSRFNRPLRSIVSLDVQTIEAWSDSWIGLNPVQAGMQVAIPEIDGATEPFVYGGMPANGAEPIALAERCRRIATRLKRWNRLQTISPSDIRLAVVLFCFPPNKGNIGTAAELDVFASLYEMLNRLRDEGYEVDPPASPDELRQMIIDGNSSESGSVANVAYRMGVDEYLKLCPHAAEIEAEWGKAPGTINSLGREILINGIRLGNVFVAVQPTFGYEGDPMRMLMSRGGSPHHGFAALYTYLEKVFRADAVIHLGTHGALEFMPGKQVGLSGECWPDRLIGELPHVYVYSVNNPSEGTIARRRSYAELVSYLTPPVEDAGVYSELAELKESLDTYRRSTSESEREQLFAQIEKQAEQLHFVTRAH